MANPVYIDIPDSTWVLVGSNVEGGKLNRGLSGAKYFWTYRESGSDAPTSSEQGVIIFDESDNEVIPVAEGIDLYVRTDGEAGSVRIDNLFFGGLSNAKTGAFQEVMTGTFDPMAQWKFGYNINPGLVTVTETNGGAVTQANSSAVLSTGTSANGAAKISTIKSVRYSPGVSGVCRFTAVFNEPVEDLVQIIGLIDDDDGWAVGYNGLEFGFLRRNDGVDDWVYQDDWNRSVFTNLNPQKGNVYQIDYQWLGYGKQILSVESDVGKITTAHQILYANQNVVPSVSNPDLAISAEIKNINGASGDYSMATPSAAAGMMGDSQNEACSVALSEDNTNVGAPIGKTVLLAFKNPTTYQGKNNRLYAKATRLSVGTDSNKPAVMRAILGATETAGAWAPINSDLTPIEVSKDAVITAGTGVQVGAWVLAKADSINMQLSDSKFSIFPGQTVYLEIDLLLGGDVNCAVNFRQFL